MKKYILISSLTFMLMLLMQCQKGAESVAEKEAYVSTVAGSGVHGFADGQGAAAQFDTPTDLAVDAAGNIYVTDSGNKRIRKVAPSGLVSTLAGSGISGFADGTGASAQFGTIMAIDIDKSGNLYVADLDNNRIRKITPAGMVSTLAGSTFGYVNGQGTAAKFQRILGLAVDGAGNVFVADGGNYRVRKISPNGMVSTYAGDGVQGSVDGNAATARFDHLVSIHADAQGNVFVTDNNMIRKISSTGVVTLLAGGTAAAFQDGPGISARFAYPFGMTSDASGNLYVGDQGNSRIRKITPDGKVSTYAGTGTAGYADGPVKVAQFKSANGMQMLPSGELFFVDNKNARIRKVGY